MSAPGVLVMAKAPVPGRVKTRLCPPCTPGEAADIACAALCDTLEAALASRHPVVLALEGTPGPWLPSGVHVVAQASGSFNERLDAAWTQLTSGGVQIGMDTPQVSAALLSGAIDATARTGSLLGLSSDGGWWILGLPRADARIFTGITMSAADTGRHQLERLHALGYRPACAPVLRDIDTWADACNVAAALPSSRTSDAVARVAVRSMTVAAGA